MTSQPRPEDTRPVWLTQQQVESITGCVSSTFPDGTQWLRNAWLAAPADSNQAVIAALWQHRLTNDQRKAPVYARAVLLALGYPHTEQA